MKYILLSALLSLLTFSVKAQINADSLYTEARKLAAGKEYQKARELLEPALQAYPGYHEIRNYIGRTYAWEEEYEKALSYYRKTLALDSTNTDAWIAIGDLFLWSGAPQQTIEEMNLAERLLSSDSAGLNAVHIRKAQAYYDLREYHSTLDALATARGNRASQLRQNTLLRLINNSLDVFGSAEFFDRSYDHMYYGTVQVGQSTKYGVGIARINTASRFGETGWQGEIDLYPRISDRMYGYINYGYSPDKTVFPEHRFGAELYSGAGSRFEVSLGVRHLYFGSGSTVTMYTGSVGYYADNYWFSIRPFITPQEDGTDVSTTAIARRYLKDNRSWITLKATYGFSPDSRRIQVGAGEVVEILQTTQIALEWQQALSTHWLLNLNFGYTRQELPFAPGSFVSIYAPGIGIKRLL